MALWLFLCWGLGDSSTTDLGFEEHLRSAIEINAERMCPYARLSNGSSLPISLLLIGGEKLLLPFARYCDKRMHSLGGIDKEGPAIFVPMDGLGLPQQKISVGSLPRDSIKQLVQTQRKVHRDWRRSLWQGGYGGIQQELKEQYDCISALEARHRVYFAMYQHILESLGHVSRQLPNYEDRPHAQKLLKQISWGHCLMLGACLQLDYLAQETHRKGVPILWHDLPKIPWP